MLALLRIALLLNPPTQDLADPPVAKEFTATYQGRVRSSFIRAQNPQLVMELGSAVRSGDARSAEFEYLFGPRLAGALTKAPPPKAGTGSSAATSSALLALVAAPEPVPDKLTFPAIYDGAKGIASTSVISLAKGTITATLPASQNFRIAQMAVHSSKIEDRTSEDSRLRSPSIRRSAPWTLPAQEGDEVKVTLVFEPKFSLSKNPAGKKTAVLSLTGPRPSGPLPWRLKVPVEGKFSGIDLGLLAWPKPADIHYIKGPGYKPGKSYSFTANAGLLSIKAGASGRITPVSLPEAVRMEPQDFNVKAGEPLDFPIRFGIETDGVFFTNDKPWPIRLKVVGGGKTQFLDYILRVFEGYHIWTLGPMEVGSVDKLYVKLYLDSRGAYVASMWGTNNHLLKNRNVYAKIFFDGKKYPIQDLFRQVGRNTGFITSITRGPNETLRNNYLEMIKAKMTVRVEVTPTY